MSEPENPAPPNQPGAGAPFGNFDWDVDRVLRTLRPLVANEATVDTLLFTTSIAALMPVLQATMSFVMAATQTYQAAHREDATIHATSMPLFMESARQILARPRVEAVAPATAAAYVSQPEKLAVT